MVVTDTNLIATGLFCQIQPAIRQRLQLFKIVVSVLLRPAYAQRCANAQGRAFCDQDFFVVHALAYPLCDLCCLHQRRPR